MHMCILGIYAFIYRCMYMNVYMWIHDSYVYVGVCIDVFAYLYECVCRYACLSINVYMQELIHACVYTLSNRGQIDLKSSADFVHRCKFSSCSIP